MTLYETIFKRRSVRNYNSNPLSEDIITNIKLRLDNIKQLKGQNARFEIVSDSAVKGGKAPRYIFAYCNDNTASYINVGYCLQEIDLYIQSLNLGSLWLGASAKPVEKKSSEGYCIMLAFGKTDMPLRKNAEDFKRLEVEKISNIDNDIIKAARLAPSAMNSQPWKLTIEKEKMAITYCGRGLLKGVLKKKFSKIDIGIITKHVELALIESGKKIISILPKSDDKDFAVDISYSE